MNPDYIIYASRRVEFRLDLLITASRHFDMSLMYGKEKEDDTGKFSFFFMRPLN